MDETDASAIGTRLDTIQANLSNHMLANDRKFSEIDSVLKTGVPKMTDTTDNIKIHNHATDPNAALIAAMGNKGNDGFMGGGLMGGLLLGSLLRNGGGLFGGNGDGAAASAMMRNPPEQNQANMDLMAGIGAVDKAVAVSTAAMEASQAQQSAGIVAQLNSVTSSLATRVDGVKETVNAMAMVLAQQINGLEKTTMENRYIVAQNITADGDKTRALITDQYQDTLNRQLTEANAALIELRGDQRLRATEVNVTQTVNQMQQQQQQQQQFANLQNLLLDAVQSIRATNQAINIGAGTLTANPTNTNTNTRVN
jgi:hypothetical protein